MTRPFYALGFIGVFAAVAVGCGNEVQADPIRRNDLPVILDVRPASPPGFHRVKGPGGGGVLPLGDESDFLRRNGAQAAYARNWKAREADVDAVNLGVLFGDESGARRAQTYYKEQLRREQRWTITDAQIGGEGYCARYDKTTGFAEYSCSWRRRNLVLSATMIADHERDFAPADVQAYAATIDAEAKRR